MQKFPANLVLCVRSDAELKLVVAALSSKQRALAEADSPDAAVLAGIIEAVKLTDESGVVTELPDAYVEVGGRRAAEGPEGEMALFFEGEIVAHSATVALFKRDGLAYRMVRIRRANRG